MDMRGKNIVGHIFLNQDILEDITGFIIHYMELGHVSSSCECVKDFLDPFVDACA